MGLAGGHDINNGATSSFASNGFGQEEDFLAGGSDAPAMQHTNSSDYFQTDFNSSAFEQQGGSSSSHTSCGVSNSGGGGVVNEFDVGIAIDGNGSGNLSGAENEYPQQNHGNNQNYNNFDDPLAHDSANDDAISPLGEDEEDDGDLTDLEMDDLLDDTAPRAMSGRRKKVNRSDKGWQFMNVPRKLYNKALECFQWLRGSGLSSVMGAVSAVSTVSGKGKTQKKDNFTRMNIV